MNRVLVLLLLASCTSPKAVAADKPAPVAKAAPVAKVEPIAKPSAAFDTSMLCRTIPDAQLALGDPSDPEIRVFGATETDPPVPSTVRKVSYRFGAGKRLFVAEMTARLGDIGALHFGATTIAANMQVEAIAALAIPGCGALQINEGATLVSCNVDEIEWTFVRGGPLADAPVEVRASKVGGCG